MTFEEYAATMSWTTVAERTKAKAVWQYQQASIDGLLEDRAKDKARIDELEQWIAAIAYDHSQIPNWIQQSAKSLLAQEQE